MLCKYLNAMMDDYKDIEMLMEYAEEAKVAGDSSASRWFVARAEKRMQMMQDAREYVIKAMHEQPEPREMIEHLHRAFAEMASGVHKKISSFNSDKF